VVVVVAKPLAFVVAVAVWPPIVKVIVFPDIPVCETSSTKVAERIARSEY
jgi:hypothetical protein